MKDSPARGMGHPKPSIIGTGPRSDKAFGGFYLNLPIWLALPRAGLVIRWLGQGHSDGCQKMPRCFLDHLGR